MTIKLLDSGYWHVRWNCNQWIQWPQHRNPTTTDVFGWVTEEMVDLAQRLAALKAAEAAVKKKT